MTLTRTIVPPAKPLTGGTAPATPSPLDPGPATQLQPGSEPKNFDQAPEAAFSKTAVVEQEQERPILPPDRISAAEAGESIPHPSQVRRRAIAPELREDIVAKPLTMPEFSSMTPVNPQHAVRWVNKDWENGRRVDQMLHSGFRFAKPSEIKNCPDSLVRDGKLVYGDLVLMLHSAEAYHGAIKYNRERALRMASQPGAIKTARQKAQQTLREQPASPGLRDKVQFYEPNSQELEKLDTGA